MKNPFAKNKRSDYENYEDYDSGFYRGDEDEEDGVVEDLDDEPAKLPSKRPTQSAAKRNTVGIFPRRVCLPRAFGKTLGVPISPYFPWACPRVLRRLLPRARIWCVWAGGCLYMRIMKFEI